MLLLPPEFLQRGTDNMITYAEFITTIALIVSIARLAFEIFKYYNEHKKK